MNDSNESVRNYLDRVTPQKRRRDAETLLTMMARATGESPKLLGTIIGFGQYHYKYASGREGDSVAAGFAPRKAATTIYLMDGVERYKEQLQRLGPHSTGVGCLTSRISMKSISSCSRASSSVLTATSRATPTACVPGKALGRHLTTQLAELHPRDWLCGRLA